MVRNFDIDGADQHALSYIESSEVFLTSVRILFSQKCLIVKPEKKKCSDFKQVYNSYPKRMPPVYSHEHILRFVDNKMEQEHVTK